MIKNFVLLLCFGCLTVTADAQRSIDVLHYKFEIFLNDESDSISGKATMKVLFLIEDNELALDLTNVSKGKGMAVISVVESQDENKLLPNTHSAEKLKITFPKKKAAGDTATVLIRYKGIPADGLIISKNKYGNRTFFSDNWPNRAHNWIPCVDDPSDKATVEFIVTAPLHYKVISNGLLLEETNLEGNKKLTHWKENIPLPTKVMAIGAADFAVNYVGDVNCVPVYSWVFPENKKEGFFDFAQAKDILAFYNNYIGPYPYRKLANVQSKTIFGGLENANAIFYSENSVTGERKEESLVAHEIVHQWFGNMATEKSFAHLWLSEGFATYLTHIYIESKYGTDSLKKRMENERLEINEFVKTSHKPVVDALSPYMELLNANSYQKGGWVLHMLRRQLGDSIFKKSIRKYYADYAGKNADTKDLHKIFEEVSGKTLEQFFKQWLYTAENPKLKITWKNIVKEKTVAVTVEQMQNSLFEFPLDLSLVTTFKKNSDKNIKVSKKIETFFFPTNSPVMQLDVDYKTSLLAEISVSQIK
ncbi:MAG: M1 family metallopeptidase [Ginsengibacter sp.]